MWKEWFVSPAEDFAGVALSTICIYLGIIAFTRIAGLRSFSKMSASDFAMTVAVGSLFASAISSPSPSALLALFALACLFAGQWAFAAARRKTSVSRFIDNAPVLLMDGPEFLEANMERTNITHDDIRAKLREANVLGLDQVRAVVFETTGDISVLHTSRADAELSSEILHDVHRSA